MYKAELIRNQGPWEDIDAVELATAEWVHWFNTIRPHSAIGMRTPGRARSRLGPRRQPEQPGTITTGNHRHQINQPPQNPGLDKAFVAECKALGMAQSTGAADSSADNALAESNGAASKREVLMDASSWGAELTCRSQTFR